MHELYDQRVNEEEKKINKSMRIQAAPELSINIFYLK